MIPLWEKRGHNIVVVFVVVVDDDDDDDVDVVDDDYSKGGVACRRFRAPN